MYKILVAGDTHIPDRASVIPRLIREGIEGKRFDLALFTGDLTGKEVEEWLMSVGNKVIIVKGNMDHLPYPRQQLLGLLSYRVGLIHGDQVYPRGSIPKLSSLARKVGVDILVSGHTHTPSLNLSEEGDVLLLNPGSLTGVWGGGGGSMNPSYMLMEVLESRVKIELIELVANHIRIRRFEARRGATKTWEVREVG